MSGINILKPGQRWKAVLLVLATCTVLLTCGGLVGYASSRNKTRHSGAPAAADTKQQQQQVTAVQLPFPDSAAARQLLADPAIPGWLHELYTHQQDSNLITAEHTEALLKQLQRALQALPLTPAAAPPLQAASSSHVSPASVTSLPAAAAEHLQLLSLYQDSHIAMNPSSSPLNPNPAAGLQPFIVAAGDVLSYLRYKQSQALLPLLRSFSRNGLQGVAVLGSNPAVLRQEVQRLLQPASLQQWYVEAARSRVEAAATSAQQPSTAFLGGNSPPVRLSHRRLMAAAAEGPAFDLTSALLSTMQGAPAHQAVAAAHPATASKPPTASTTAAPLPAAEELFGSSSGLVQKATANSGLLSGWGPARPAPVPAVVAAALGASAVAEPDYLAFDFEDGGAGGETFEEEALTATTTTTPTSNAKASRQLGQVHGSQRAEGGAGLAAASSSNWVRLQAEDSTAGLAAETEVSTSPALQADGSVRQQQQQQLGADVPPSQPPPAHQRSSTQVESQQSAPSLDNAALCDIQQFSPVGVQRGPESVSCPTPHLRYYSQGGWVFRPLMIPVIFHCLTFTRVLPSSVSPAGLGVEGPDAQVLLPPNWQASAAAGNLIDQANKVFFNTGIQFKLQEVRHDPQKHTYLQQPNLESWQSCSYNAATPSTGVSCLSKVARQVDAAASPLALHVFVSGSRDEGAYCPNDAAAMGSVCRSVASAYSGARGPWKGPLASSSWREDVLAENLVFLSWDTFNPASSNSARFANRGGSIFASQLAQHLGLGPNTAAAAAGASSCVAQQQQQQQPALASWCSAFRQGRQPPVSELSAVTGCFAAGGSFGVVEPSVPDNCAMTFSAGQVAALQAAVAMYRPKLHAAYVA